VIRTRVLELPQAEPHPLYLHEGVGCAGAWAATKAAMAGCASRPLNNRRMVLAIFIVVALLAQAGLAQPSADSGANATDPTTTTAAVPEAGPSTPLPLPITRATGGSYNSAVATQSPSPVLLNGATHNRCLAGGYVANNGSCPCAAGWAGRDCMACNASTVCPAFTGEADSTCDTGLYYNNHTAYKAYDCDLVGGLSKWVSGVAAMCNVRGERMPYKDGPLGLQVGRGFAALGGCFSGSAAGCC